MFCLFSLNVKPDQLSPFHNHNFTTFLLFSIKFLRRQLDKPVKLELSTEIAELPPNLRFELLDFLNRIVPKHVTVPEDEHVHPIVYFNKEYELQRLCNDLAEMMVTANDGKIFGNDEYGHCLNLTPSEGTQLNTMGIKVTEMRKALIIAAEHALWTEWTTTKNTHVRNLMELT